MTETIRAGELDYVDPDFPQHATDETPGVSEEETEEHIQDQAAREARETSQQ
jgi:hypothetical protein